MNHRIRLGPVAVFLAIVSVVLATMAVLTTATTHADLVLARRFADVTADRYRLESEGEKFLRRYDEDAADGTVNAGVLGMSGSKEGYSKQITEGRYTLNITLTEPDRAGGYEIREWKISREWNADDPMSDIWKGD